MPQQAVTTVEQRPDLVLVRVELDAIDERNLEAVQAEVGAAGAASPQLPVAVDMARVKFIPSVTMSGLILLSRQFRSRTQRLVFINLQPDVRAALAVMRLDRVLEIHHDLSGVTGGIN